MEIRAILTGARAATGPAAGAMVAGFVAATSPAAAGARTDALPASPPSPPAPVAPTARAPAASAAMATAAMATAPDPSTATDTTTTRWFPAATAFAPLLADPQEPGFRGSFVLADRPGARGYEGRNIEAEVTLGHEFAVARFQTEDRRLGRPEMALGFEVAVFSRFFMESAQRDLVAVDYRVGFPLSFRYRSWEGRLELQHYSSHFGDDYVRAFEPEVVQVSREGMEVVAARRLGGGVRLYAGGRVAFHANEGVERSAARMGLEWDPGSRDAYRPRRRGAPDRGPDAAPFLAVDLQSSDAARGLAATATAGARIRIAGPALRAVRLEARAHFGPSPLGRFASADESFYGLGLRLEF